MVESKFLWSVEDFLAATGGRLEGPAPGGISGVSIDSRTIEPGEAFIAIAGERMDGHDFAAAALEAGASLAVVGQDRAGAISARPLVVVADPLEALRGLARAARARSRAISDRSMNSPRRSSLASARPFSVM